MLGLVYLLIAVLIGQALLRRFLPGLLTISQQDGWQADGARVPDWMVALPAAWLIGSLVMTWVTYFLCLILQVSAKPMLLGAHVSLGFFTVLALWLARRQIAGLGQKIRQGCQGFTRRNRLEKLYTLAALLMASFIAFYTMIVVGHELKVGFSVWSDFGPHLAVIRSFSFGDNFPTEYPHFPAGNIRYHFLFQFMAATLEALGLRIDFALNLPSLLSLSALFMLLYALAVHLSGKRAIGVLVGCLFIFRSSFAFFTFLKQILNEGNAWERFWNVGEHIGKTQNEAWGLWAQNVYANQRHFAFSLSVLILILLVMLPLLRKWVLALQQPASPPLAQIAAAEAVAADAEPALEPAAQTVVVEPQAVEAAESDFVEAAQAAAEIVVPQVDLPMQDRPADSASESDTAPLISEIAETVLEAQAQEAAQPPCSRRQRLALVMRESFGRWNAWWPESWARALMIGVLLGAIGFWNGAVLIAALLILFVISIFAKHKIEFLIVAVLAVGLAQLQSVLFIGTEVAAVKPEFTVGFLAQNKSLAGILAYFIELLGVLPLMLALAVLVVPKGWRVLALAFLAPLLFAATMTLTPDVNANHKFILIAVIFLNMPVAWLIHRWWTGGARELRLLAGVMFSLLIVTGLVDLLTLYNINRNRVVVDLRHPVTAWVKQNSQPGDVFLTDWSVLHPVQVAGRKIYYGWPYYAWSAGYDTRAREPLRNRIYSTTSSEEMKQIAREQGIRFIVVDNAVRESREYHLNEPLLKETFPLVFSNERDNTRIYKVY